MLFATGSATRLRLARVLPYGFAGLLFLGLPLLTAPAHAQSPFPRQTTFCGKTKATLNPQGINFDINGGISEYGQPDLVVDGTCTVNPSSDYYYGKVNIIDGGKLIFREGASADLDKVTNFWAQSIIVENNGTMQAGESNAPYGTNKHTLNIILYGKDQTNNDPINKPTTGDTCSQANCGVPGTMWANNGKTQYPGCGLDKGNAGQDCLPGQSTDSKDYFYQYGPVYGTTTGYYGSKVIGVGYGGTLRLHGLKGTTGGANADKDPTKSGTSWVRLADHLVPSASGGSALLVDGNVGSDWQPGDKIVVTTTDYLPGHSEQLTITALESQNRVYVADPIKWKHQGKAFDLARLTNAGAGFKKAFTDNGGSLPKSAETRAAVALLTRSIRVVSGGDFAGDYFDCVSHDSGKTWVAPQELSHNRKEIPVAKENCATARNGNYSFGGHTSFRQGFQKLQLQGVEFHQMGQGGRIQYYPVHFHMVRQAAPETYIKDSSVSESMTRWVVLHSTLGVTLQRNVGWKSIGHGFYLEDGTETDNKFYSNIGIYARAGVVSADNPRNIPGILASPRDEPHLRYRSDVAYPTVFWITNGWNEFVGNMAAGAGTCGICYWYLPAANNDMVESNPMNDDHSAANRMLWTGLGYAGRQTAGHEGETPVKLFYKNYCTTAMHSLTTGDGISKCLGVRAQTEAADARIEPVPSIAPPRESRMNKDNKPLPEMYYPNITAGNRVPSVCNVDGGTSCNVSDYGQASRCDNASTVGCATTVIDSYTTSFHWAETNFSAVWLRTPGWFLMTDSFVSDVQNGGVTFVTGGDYSRSSSPTGYWGLMARSVFVGATQPSNPFAYAAGPRSAKDTADTGCAFNASTDPNVKGALCIRKDEGVYYPLSNWATGQRLLNIYDGPAHQEANAYLDIKVSDCGSATADAATARKTCMYFGTPGVRKFQTKWTEEGKEADQGYLPNAAIGWKQPNGFYYPPAFHSKNLFFDNVDIRHYVIQPLYKPRSYQTDDTRVQDEFVGIRAGTTGLMTGFTDVDRQTVLNDDDGTLTGFIAATNPTTAGPTISVNEDGFFAAPFQAAQCKSNAGTTPAVACAAPPSTNKSPTPPTARTSPYEYVTTVVYPGCAIKKGEGANPPDWETKCGTTDKNTKTPYQGDTTGSKWAEIGQRGGTWSRDCAGPYCFGVPIYRQYLTGAKITDKGKTTTASTREWKTWADKKCDDNPNSDDCDFPFARMSGASEWQRNIMTVNNGKFYIDTTRSLDYQKKSERLGSKDNLNDVYVECDEKARGKGGACEPRSVNLFEPGQTYYVFMMFATPTTRQTYQIYVGEKFQKSMLNGIQIVYVDGFFGWDDWKDAVSWTDPNKPLFAKMRDGSTKGKSDILEVTIDYSKLSGISVDPKDPKNKGQVCKPLSFCKWTGSTCGCNLNDTKDPKDVRLQLNGNLKAVCDRTCKEWAVKDLDGPTWKSAANPSLPDFKTARLGFAFTLPPAGDGGFNADNTNRRPPPEPFPDTNQDKTASPWKTINLSNTTIDKKPLGAGDCTYSVVPGTTSQCQVPDCAPGMGPPPFCDQKK